MCILKLLKKNKIINYDNLNHNYTFNLVNQKMLDFKGRKDFKKQKTEKVTCLKTLVYKRQT